MNIFPKTQTDAEFVEAVRKRLTRSKWIALPEAIIGIAAWCGALLLLHFVLQIAGTGIFETQTLPDGLRIGISIGTIMAMAMIFGTFQIGLAMAIFNGNRITKLMLKYHDEIQHGNVPDKQERQNGSNQRFEAIGDPGSPQPQP